MAVLGNDKTNFEQMFPEDLKIMEGNKTKIAYLKGENIFKQGAFAPYVIYIVSGLVKVYLQTGYDKHINIGIAQKGEFLAFSSVFGEKVHSYSTQAITNAEVCMIEKESLKNALLKNPEFALQITSKNYRNERLLIEIIKNLSYKQMRGKLASAIIYLSQIEFLNENIFENLTRQEIADFASISTESAIKFLKEFEKEGIVFLNGKNIEIIQQEKLEQLSKNG
jgi:CRP/FNR family transcriptional regulator